MILLITYYDNVNSNPKVGRRLFALIDSKLNIYIYLYRKHSAASPRMRDS